MDNDKYHNYENKPLKLLWDTRSELLPKYLRYIWYLIGLSLFLGVLTNYVNINDIEVMSYLDLSVSGLSFTLVIVSAVLEIYNKEELTILLNYNDPTDRRGLALLETLTPYIFTATIYLVIGLVSIISPLIQLKISVRLAAICNYLFIMLLILGLFSLFNITYTLLSSLYYSVVRENRVRELKIKILSLISEKEAKKEQYANMNLDTTEIEKVIQRLYKELNKLDN